MSIIIVNGSIDGRYVKDYTCIDFSTKGTVTNIEESNWSMHATCLLRGEPLKNSSTFWKICGDIIIIQRGEGFNASKLHL